MPCQQWQPCPVSQANANCVNFQKLPAAELLATPTDRCHWQGHVVPCRTRKACTLLPRSDRPDKHTETTWSIDLVSLPNGCLTSSQHQRRKREGPASGNGAPDASERPSALVVSTSCWPPCARTHVYGKQVSTLPMGMWLPNPQPRTTTSPTT